MANYRTLCSILLLFVFLSFSPRRTVFICEQLSRKKTPKYFDFLKMADITATRFGCAVPLINNGNNRFISILMKFPALLLITINSIFLPLVFPRLVFINESKTTCWPLLHLSYANKPKKAHTLKYICYTLIYVCSDLILRIFTAIE